MRLYSILIVIKLINEVISDSLNCDFDTNDCTWYPVESPNSITWRWTGPIAESEGHGGYLEVPTEGSSIGQLSQSTNRDPYSIIGSIRNLWYIPRSGCFSFSYRFYSLESSWLNLTLQPTSDDPVLLYSIKDGRSLDWSRVSVDIGNSPEFYLVFAFSLKLTNSSKWIISLDDFTFIKDKQCSDFTLCDFETGSCHWKLSGWQRVTAGQSIPTDHSTLTPFGHFIEPKVFGSKSELSLTPLPSTVLEGCLAFWTFVDLRQIAPQLLVRQWIDNQQSEDWKVNLGRPAANYQSWQYHRIPVSLQKSISIETIASSSFPLAIDDLILYEGSCSIMGTCDFSFDSCGWFNSGQSFWQRQIGLLPALSSSPQSSTIRESFDSHQWYMISDTNGGQAILEIIIDGPICFSFSYLFMDTATPNNLTIKLDRIDGKIITDKKVQFIEEIPLRPESSLNWNHFERTINVQPNGWFTLSLIVDQDNQSNVILIDDLEIGFEKCLNETRFDPLIVTTTSVATIESDCCISEPCICVISDSLSTHGPTPTKATTQSVKVTEPTETSTEPTTSTMTNEASSTTDGLTTTSTYTSPNDLETESTINPLTTELITSEFSTLITTTNEQSTETLSTTTINYNQVTSSTPYDEVPSATIDQTSTPSTIEPSSTLHFDQSTVNIPTESTPNPEQSTEYLIDPLTKENETINSPTAQELSLSNFGGNLISIFNIILDERSFSASISGIFGLILLVIGLIVLTLNWKQPSSQRPRNQHVIVAPEDMELQTLTFRRRTSNPNNLTQLDEPTKC